MRQGALRYAPKASGVHVGGSKPGAGAYWRRRFIVLGVCLAALAAAAWSVSHVVGVQPIRPTASSGTTGEGAGGGAPAAGSGSRQGIIGAPGSHAGSGSLRGQGSSPGTRQALGASVRPAASGRLKPGFCPWHAVVLSVTANQGQFSPVQQPVFRVSVVSTQRTACSFDVGPGHLALVIKAGSARVWSSGDCVYGPASVNGAGSLVMKLRRGVPAMVSIAWDKERSSPGCGGPVRPVPSGIYSAYGVDGPLVSAPLAIRLR